MLNTTLGNAETSCEGSGSSAELWTILAINILEIGIVVIDGTYKLIKRVRYSSCTFRTSDEES